MHLVRRPLYRRGDPDRKTRAFILESDFGAQLSNERADDAHAKPSVDGRIEPFGQADPIVPASNSAHLAALLTQAGASVTHKVLPAGHQLSQADVTLARNWIGDVAAEAA